MRIDSPDTASAGGQPPHDPVHAARATRAAVEFERFFIAHMLRTMRASTRALAAEDSVFNNRVDQDMQDMADDLLAGNLAGQRAFGIADAILRQLLPALNGRPQAVALSSHLPATSPGSHHDDHP